MTDKRDTKPAPEPRKRLTLTKERLRVSTGAKAGSSGFTLTPCTTTDTRWDSYTC
jgi:hypothetical protein